MLCCQLDAWSFSENARVNGSAVLPALVQLQSIPTVKNSVDCAKNQPCEAMTQKGGGGGGGGVSHFEVTLRSL